MAKRLNDDPMLNPADSPFDSDQIAHEMRDQIAVISGRAQLLRRRIRHGTLDLTDLERSLAQIEAVAARLTKLLNRLDGDS